MSEHIPVLLAESLQLLSPQSGNTVLDVTLGLGGHGKEFCQAIGTKGTFIGLDADEENLALAQKSLADQQCKMTFIHKNFADVAAVNLPNIDIVFADLGVSSLHFDLPERGFSHRFEGPLDLRLDRNSGRPFFELIADVTQAEILQMLQDFGELSRPYKLSRTLYEKRNELATTTDLKNVIDEVYTFKAKQYYGKVFQAFRIFVNQELTALQNLLQWSISSRIPKIGIISFHSLEDRLVKQAFRAACANTKDEHTGQSLDDALYTDVTRKPVVPTAKEQDLNPRSRSAKLRVIVLKDHARSQ